MLPPRRFVSRALVLTAACLSQTAIGQGPTFGVPAAGGGPSLRYDTAIAFDAARGRTVLFGGYDPFGSSAGGPTDTWEWDGVAWVQRLPATIPAFLSPGFQLPYEMAYAPGAGTVLSLGLAQWTTWVWDGVDWCAYSGPPRGMIYGEAVAYHGGSNPGLLHVGDPASSAPACETWLRQGTSWSLRSTTGPTKRQSASAAYCPVTFSTYLFGGTTPSGGPQNDTWRWSGLGWSQVNNLGTPPGPPGYADCDTMTWDGGRGALVVVQRSATYFGYPVAESPNDIIWSPGPHPATPPGSYRSSSAFDTARQRLVLYACINTNGQQFSRFFGELPQGTNTWIDLGSPSPAPSARSFGDMTFDPDEGTILFGGLNGSQALADTWTFDGNRWTYRGAGSAPARLATALCYSPDLGQAVMFGGGTPTGSCFGDTRLWNGSAWRRQYFWSGGPAARMHHDMVYDAANQRIVLFGGWNGTQRLADTWVLQQGWAGLEWTQIGWSGSGPPARNAHRMAYDAQRQCVVLFGGQGASGNFLGDTWELVGSTWTQVVPAQAPPPRWNHIMDFDPLRGVVVLIGGYLGGVFADDVWEYGGGTWTQRTPRSTKPASREGAGFTWDDRLQRFVIRGGYSWSTGLLGDTWFYDGR